MKIVREDEKYMIGGLNHGHYLMQDDFGISITTDVTKLDDDELT